MKEITFQLNKQKIILLLIGSAGFVIFGIWLFQIADTIFIYSILTKIVSVACITFFGFGAVYLSMKLFDNKPGLIINDDGIIDNSSYISVGLIRWKNITNVSITEIDTQKILTIELNNADEIIQKQNGSKKVLMSLNKNLYKSPVQISSIALKCDFHELYSTLKEQLAAHQGALN